MLCSLQLVDVGVTHGVGDDPRHPPRCLEWVRKKFQMTNFSIPNNFSFMKHAEKIVPGLADVGVPHGSGDGPEIHPDVWWGPAKSFQMTNLTIPNNFSFMKHAEKLVPGLDDVGVPHGNGDGPRTPPRCMEGGLEKVSND